MGHDTTILYRTAAYCGNCRVTHPAVYERDGNAVYFSVECFLRPSRIRVSDDADLFIHFRNAYNAPLERSCDFEGYKHVNFIEITNQCNYSCNICYTSSPIRQNGVFRSRNDILKILRSVVRQGGYAVSITGGEPTLHPQLIDIIKDVKKTGLIVNLQTNGHLLGTDPALARRLYMAGLHCISIQFDTLDPVVHRMHRNNEYIEEKKAAIRNCSNAGTRIIVTITVTNYNINCVDEVVRYVRGFSPKAWLVSILPLYKTGHVSIGGDSLGICRERIVRAICSAGVIKDLSPASFRPLPFFAPAHMCVHPDCGAIAVVLTGPSDDLLLDKAVDMDKLYRLLGAYRRHPGKYAWALFLLTISIFRASNKRFLIRLIRSMYGFMTGKGRYGVLILSVENFQVCDFQDEQRMRRCATAIRTLDGLNHDGCFIYRKQIWK